MANTVTVKVEGLDDIEDKLYNLPSKFAKAAMRRALRPAADIWRSAMESAAPEHTGWLRSQAKISIRLSAKEESGTALVGFSTKQNPNRKGEHVPSAGNEAFWDEMGTIHQPARPFIRPVFESEKENVLDKFVAGLKEAFDEVFGQ